VVEGARSGGSRTLMSSLSEELVQISDQGIAAVLATVIETEGADGIQPGAKCIIRDGHVSAATIHDPQLIDAILRESEARLREE